MIYLEDLLTATGAQLNGPATANAFDSFCFDSRLVRPGQLFLAVRTERADGHDHIADACRGGATGVLCQNPAQAAGRAGAVATCLVVPDTRLAIQEWARYVLAKQRLDIVGITGSVGKTTAKEAIAAVLGARYPVFKNRANYNGLYGLPIALGELQPDQQVAVIEMAADHFGEIRRLAEIAPPQIAVVTTVEPAHLETFGSLDAIAREKGALVAALPSTGLAVLNGDDPRVLAMAARTSAPVLTYGTRAQNDTGAFPDIYAHDMIVSRAGLAFVVETPSGSCKVSLPLLGRHQVYAALAAIAVGQARSVALHEIVQQLDALPHVSGRLNPLPGRRGSLLLDDSYGSSPAAAEAALDTLAAVEGRRKIAVLGDMLELGSYEAAGHEQVGRRAAGSVDLLVTRGDRARRIAEAARAAGLPADQVVVTYTAEDAVRAVLDRLGPGDVVLVKGSLATRMEQVTRAVMEDPASAAEVLVRQDAAWQGTVTVSPDRPTWLEIDLGAIGHNVRRLKELAGNGQIMISLKADAYGHGAVQVAHTALLNGASWLGVACYSEGVALRHVGITAPILVLGYTPAWQVRDALRHDLTITLFDLDVARALSHAALALDRPARAHVKIDTGMGRLGISPADAVKFVRAVVALPGLMVEGIFTHLSVADGTGEWQTAYTSAQLDAFEAVLGELSAAGLHVPLVHALNSAGLLRLRAEPVGNSRRNVMVTPSRSEAERRPTPMNLDASQLARAEGSELEVAAQLPLSGENGSAEALPQHQYLIRAGIAVYGLDPSPEVRCPPDFRPALAWKTQVAQVKELAAGSYVGYGATYQTQGAERIAVIPIGYADGFRRAPLHWGEVLVRGQRAPIVGRVCMDQTMIDVTNIPGVRQGDEVVLIGPQGTDRISAEEVAARLGTINYEVVSAILARVPRTAVT